MKVLAIGRSTRNDVVLRDASVSRVHCQIIQHDNGMFSIVDFDSTNGTFVNGRRIHGQVSLEIRDAVEVGKVAISWQNYFSTVGSQLPHPTPPKSNILPIVLGIAGGILLITLIVLLFVKFRSGGDTTPMEGQQNIDGVIVDFNMSMDDVRRKNTNATITPYHVNEVQKGTVYIAAFDYYTINNNIAVTVVNQNISQIFTWNPNYYTRQRIHVGCTWDEVEKAYPQLQFFYMSYTYHYEMRRYEKTVRAYDPATCTSFYFYESQFSQEQWTRLIAVAGKVQVNGAFSVSAISATAYQSIRSSIRVALIEVGSCGNSGAGSSASNVVVANPNQNEASGQSAEQAVRRLGVAMCDGDIATIRSLTTADMYDEIMASFTHDYATMDETSKQKSRKAFLEMPAQTIRIGDNKVVVRFKNERGQVDFYMKNEGKWVCFDYARGGVHVPKSMRRQVLRNNGYY